MFAVSVYLQAGVRFEGLQTALTTLPFSVVLAILSFATPGLGKKIAPKWIVVAGAVVMGFGIFMAGQLATRLTGARRVKRRHHQKRH